MTFFIALPLVMRSVNQTLWVKSSTLSTGGPLSNHKFRTHVEVFDEKLHDFQAFHSLIRAPRPLP